MSISLTLLFVIQTGDHMAVPKDRDSILTTPAESTVTGVPSSENLKHKTNSIKVYTYNGKICSQRCVYYRCVLQMYVY